MSIGYGSSTATASVLGFGLTNVEPFEERYIRKIGHLKEYITVRGLRPSVSITDYLKTTNFVTISDLKLPTWCDNEKIIATLTEREEKYLEDNPDLKKSLEEVMKEKDKPKSARSFVSFLNCLQEKYSADLPRWLRSNTLRFLNSDFPFSVSNDISLRDYAFGDCLKIMHEQTRWLAARSRALMRLSFGRFSRAVDEYRRRLRPLVQKETESQTAHDRLLLYLDLCNSTGLGEVFKPKYLSKDKVDSREFERLYNHFKESLRDLRATLMHYEPNILSRDVQVSEPTKQMWKELATVCVTT